MSSAVLERQSWLDGLRASHGLGAAELTLPPSRQEDWRFTDLAPLLQLDPRGLKPCGSASSAAWLKPQADVVRLQLGADGLSFCLAPVPSPGRTVPYQLVRAKPPVALPFARLSSGPAVATCFGG